MKTNQASLSPRNAAKASNNLLGGLLLLTLVSTAVISINFVAMRELITAFDSQWMNFMHSMSAFMAQAHP